MTAVLWWPSQLLREAATAALYRRVTRSGTPGRFRRRAASLLFRGYLTAAGGQYVHGLVMNLPIVAVGYLAGDYHAGLFGFSFVLAAQANTVIVGRLGVILQPLSIAIENCAFLATENYALSGDALELSRFGGQVTFEVRNAVAERTVLLTEPTGQASAGQ